MPQTWIENIEILHHERLALLVVCSTWFLLRNGLVDSSTKWWKESP